MEYLYWAFSYLLTTTKLFSVMFIFFQRKHKPFKVKFIPIFFIGFAVIVFATILVFDNDSAYGNISWLSVILANMFIFTLLDKKSDIVRQLCTFMVLSILEGILLPIVYLVSNTDYWVARPAPVITLIAEIISLAIITGLSLFRYQIRSTTQWTAYDKHKSLFILLAGGLISISFFASPVILISMQLTGAARTQIIFGLSISCVIFLAVYILNYYTTTKKVAYERQAQEYQNYVASQKKYYESLINADKRSRHIRHDMLAHFSSISTFLHAGEINKTIDYVDSLNKSTVQLSNKRITGNTIIDMVLSESKAKHPQLDFNVAGSLPDTTGIEDIDLCILFSNIFSNAINATTASSGDIIKMEIRHLDRNLHVIVSNPIDNEIIFKKGLPVRQKKSINHGYGIQNIVEIINKYNGTYSFTQQDGIFCVEFVLINVLT